MGRVKELWQDKVDHVYQSYEDGKLLRGMAVKQLKELNLDEGYIRDQLDGIDESRQVTSHKT